MIICMNLNNRIWNQIQLYDVKSDISGLNNFKILLKSKEEWIWEGNLKRGWRVNIEVKKIWEGRGECNQNALNKCMIISKKETNKCCFLKAYFYFLECGRGHVSNLLEILPGTEMHSAPIQFSFSGKLIFA